MSRGIAITVGAALGILLCAGVDRPADNGTKIEQLYQQQLADHPGMEVTIITVEYAPGAATPPHEHPGYTYAYVLEGAVTSKLDNGEERTYRKGEMWSESPHQHHVVSRNASATASAKFLVMFIAPKGQALTTMLPAK